MKIVTIAFFMNMSNDVSYLHDTKCRIQTCKIKDLKEKINFIRNALIEEYKNEVLSNKLKSYQNYQISFAISIVNTEKETVRYKRFKIKPINLNKR